MTDSAESEKALVFVTVGTDHHPFDRLMRWVDRWLADGGGDSARCLVQAGTSARPQIAEATDYLRYDEMREAVGEAAAVVTHGGPGSIALARSLGKRPIVVPRRKDLGEHVDDHQHVFARRIADEGKIDLAESEDAFRAALERALRAPAAPMDAIASEPLQAVQRFEQLAGELIRNRGTHERERSRAVRVLYIGGAGRSGSTLLDLILGEIPGLFAAGELKYIWDRGVRDNELCGCGERFHTCPFWTAVGERAFGGWGRVDVDEVLALEHAVDNHRSIPLMWKPDVRAGYEARFERFVDVLERLYTAVAAVSGAAAIVDSTKRPSSAFLLSRIPAFDVRFVQLVRDSRGVAYSWSKRVRRPEVTDGVDFMPRYDAVKAGARWMANNSLFHVLARLGVPGIRIRYESLVASPRSEVERVVRHAGIVLAPDALDFLDRGAVELGTNHIVAGNPLRLGRTSLDLRVDDTWRSQMDRRQRSLVALLTWPLLLRYGYLGRSGAPPSSDAERSAGGVAARGDPSD